MNIQYGDVILVHGDDPLSKIIRALTGSYWSHTLLALEFGEFAQMGSIGFTTGRQSLNRPYAILRHKELMNPYSLKAQEYFFNMQGVVGKLKANPPMFDYFNLIGLGIKLIAQKMLSVSVLSQTTGPFVCSALIDYVYKQSGINLRPGKDPRDTTPANLADLAFGKEAVFKVIYSSQR